MSDDMARMLGLHPLMEARRLGREAHEILSRFDHADRLDHNVVRLPIYVDRIRQRLYPAGETCVILPFPATADRSGAPE